MKKSLNYTILVTGCPFSGGSATTALKFCEALIKRHHKIHCVFFYSNAAWLGNELITAPADEVDIKQQWQQFSHKNKLSCMMCVSNSLRRGISDEANIAPGFKIKGLADLIFSIQESDRLYPIWSKPLKKLLFVFRNAPYSGLIAQEGIELLLLSASYTQDVSVLFLGNAVLQLIKAQHPEKILRKNIGKMLTALPLYEIKNIYAEQQAMDQYQLAKENLLIDCQIVNPQRITEIIHNQQGIINC